MANAESLRRFKRRDRLVEMEHSVRNWWDEAHVFDTEANDPLPKAGYKFFGTFPFPYMNGYLHLGHAFSLSKLEFAAAYHRLRGANVLLPFAFHCTGMPILASADKLKREMETFTNPPFPSSLDTDKITIEPHEVKPDSLVNVQIQSRFKGKKSKAASKIGKETSQWEIMRGYDLSDDEIARFRDPVEWLRFFPPLAVEDLKAFGLGADWRRLFITTDLNPFFNSFVRWQMNKFKAKGKIVEAERYTIYSPSHKQPCLDHDRASGEGVVPQEYTLVKMEVVPPFPANLAALEGKKKKLYLAAATLRLEEGQTNSWVLPDEKYGAFKINESELFILIEHAARNLAHQQLSLLQPTKPLVELYGRDLIRLRHLSPLATGNEIIHCLPMLSVSKGKGTGIVISFPTDSSHKSMPLQDAFRKKLLELGQAIIYYEPEKKVISRSGEECVVALTKQWYLTYGESSWRKDAEACLSEMKLYSEETKHGFEHALSWLNQWECSRTFGLWTRIPWDEDMLVESLSDSTIYMAYYTFCHLLQNGDLFGSDTFVKPEQLIDEVWDYVFLSGPEPESSSLPLQLLNKMKQEFEYWYPVDIRVSGKDLIQNHLTFCIYNHTAIFPKRHWPRGFRCNGHIMLNSEKMSKSTGNFRTLKQVIVEFSADATRFSLADAGDGFK